MNCISKNKCQFIEFWKIYKRLMEIEIQLRERIINSFIVVYNDKCFYRIMPYLEKVKSNYDFLRRHDKKKSNHIGTIINSKNKEEEKLRACIYRLYLSDLLGILDFKVFYRDKFLIKNLYLEKPVHNDIKHYSACLKNLRNCIMHFNFGQYTQNRIDFIDALIFFENRLHCFMREINHIEDIDNTSVQGILEKLYVNCPEIFNGDDRQLCDVFDDIAIINGKPADQLPQYWTILRTKYQILSREKIMTLKALK